MTKLTVTGATCNDGIKVVKAWGKRAPSPCIHGNFVKVKGTYKGRDTCKVIKYSCVGDWKYANPKDVNRALISYSTTCKQGKKQVNFTALVTRASS